MVQQFEEFFDAVHQIVLMFFFKLAVFTPALTNAVLVGLAINHFVTGKWGWFAGLVAGCVTAVSIEAAGLILSWNMQKGSQWLMVSLYVAGSWILVWLGLNDGWLTNVVGFIMPIFAVAAQWTVASHDRQKKLAAESRDLAAMELEKTKEITKQERAKARAAKNLQKSAKNEQNYSKNDVLLWLAQNPDASTGKAADMFGVTTQTIRNYRKELETQNGASPS